MKHERYKYSAENELMYFEFISTGPKGQVKKIIEFSETNVKDVYNLAFGDFDEQTQRISDRVVTNNGDSLKYLLQSLPRCMRSLPSGLRHGFLQREVPRCGQDCIEWGLTNNLSEISKDFHLYGLQEDQWVDFLLGEDYKAFLVKRKYLSSIRGFKRSEQE